MPGLYFLIQPTPNSTITTIWPMCILFLS